jgi:hypothetical protein
LFEKERKGLQVNIKELEEAVEENQNQDQNEVIKLAHENDAFLQQIDTITADYNQLEEEHTKKEDQVDHL